jgi:hypothetical protein
MNTWKNQNLNIFLIFYHFLPNFTIFYLYFFIFYVSQGAINSLDQSTGATTLGGVGEFWRVGGVGGVGEFWRVGGVGGVGEFWRAGGVGGVGEFWRVGGVGGVGEFVRFHYKLFF